MRCTNCGWENPDDYLKCEKCNSKLSNAQSGGMRRPVGPREGTVPSSTIPEGVPFDSPTTPDTSGGTEETIIDGNPIVIDIKPPKKVDDGPNPGYQGGTIGPWNTPGQNWIPVAYCKLTPVIFPGENPRHAPSEVSIKGDTNLNRENLDKDNPTITTKVQAALTNKDGKWYIQDKSAQKTTFVHAGDPIQLKDGDIILMGNRTFIFNED